MKTGIDREGCGLAKSKLALIKANYEPFFAPLKGQSIKLLELGIFKGASLRFWRDYFENGIVIGLDCNPPLAKIDDPNGRIHTYQGYQQDIQLIDRIVKEQAPEGFDVIIDDCSHIGRFARISFWHLFQNHLKPGGLYAIEDWTTGYSRSFPDGKRYKPKSRLKYTSYEHFLDSLSNSPSDLLPNFPRLSVIISRMIPSKFFISAKIPSHEYGMVGFVKELVDASFLGARAIPRSGTGRYFDYGIKQLWINASVVVVSKSKDKDVNASDAWLSKDCDYTPYAYMMMQEQANLD